MSAFGPKALDTTRLRRDEKQHVIDSLERGRASHRRFGAERRSPRLRCRGEEMAVRVLHPGGSQMIYNVTPRNISTGGMAFLHGAFLHPGSRCHIALRRLDGEMTLVTGCIVDCRHLHAHIHEAALRFDKPIELAAFAALPGRAPATPPDGEAEDQPEDDLAPLAATARVLLVDDFEPDRRMLEHMIGKLGLQPIATGDFVRAREILDRGQIDIAIVERHLEAIRGIDLAASFRRRGFRAPILMLSAEDAAEDEVDARLCSGVIHKPFQPKQLRATLAKVLLSPDQRPEPLISTLAAEADMRPLIRTFVDAATGCLPDLHRCIDAGDLNHLRLICTRMKGSAASHGFAPLTDAAGEVLQHSRDIDDPVDAEVEALRNKVNEMIDLITRMRA